MPLVVRLADVVMSTGRAVAHVHPGAEALGDRLRPFFPPVDSDDFRAENVDGASRATELRVLRRRPRPRQRRESQPAEGPRVSPPGGRPAPSWRSPGQGGDRGCLARHARGVRARAARPLRPARARDRQRRRLRRRARRRSSCARRRGHLRSLLGPALGGCAHGRGGSDDDERAGRRHRRRRRRGARGRRRDRASSSRRSLRRRWRTRSSAPATPPRARRWALARGSGRRALCATERCAQVHLEAYERALEHRATRLRRSVGARPRPAKSRRRREDAA